MSNPATSNNAAYPAVQQDTSKALTALQHAIRMCRPQNVLNFAVRYLQDEQSSSEENHAIHMLPFLISQSEEFCNAACTIFCAQQQHAITIVNPASTSNNATDSNGLPLSSNNNSTVNLLEAGLPPPAPVVAATTTRKYYREYLDANHVTDILQLVDFQNNFRLTHPLVDDYISERIEKLRRIDFDLFLSSLRFVIGCYQIVAYVKDELYDYLKVYEASTVELPIPDEINIDLIKWKTFMMKKSGQLTNTSIRMLNNPTNPTIIPATASMARVITTTTSNTSSNTMGVGGRTVETHNFHLHHLSNESKTNLEVDIKLWHQTLMQLLEEERNTMMTVEAIVARVLRRLIEGK